MTDAVTDTHALIWYLEDSPRLSDAANNVFEQWDRGEIVIYIPTICLVEIVYLQERNRISADLRTRLDAELKTGRTGLILHDLTAKVVEAFVGLVSLPQPNLQSTIDS